MTVASPGITVRVSAIRDLAPLVREFRLEAADGGALPAFSGGSHILVDLPDGDIVHRNPYSLACLPDDRGHYAIAVRREANGRGGSRLLHDVVGVGSALRISHPVNSFPLDLRARKHVFIAGGVGITPFVAMAGQAAEAGMAFELHQACRSRQHAIYRDMLELRHGARTHLYCSDEGCRLPLDAILAHQPLGTHLYVCGPASLIAEALALARSLGWPDGSLHGERFLAPASGAPFRVRLARSGLTVEVGRNRSMLEAIEDAGGEAPSLCRGGACGQCRTTVLACDGRLLHADMVLTDHERASGAVVMPCVSRFEGQTLELDL